MKRLYGIICCVITYGSLQSQVFFKGCQGVQSLDEFVTCAVSPQDSQEFNKYYHATIAKNKKKSAEARQKIRTELQEQALCALEVKKPEWARVVKRQSETKEAKVFLTRYGMLEDFYKTEAQKTGNTWSKVVTFGKNIVTKSGKKLASLKQKIQRKSQTV